MGLARVFESLLAAAATPSPVPTPAIDPVDVTPGPAGFFVTIGLMLAVGLIAMGLMTRSARATAKYDLREAAEQREAQELSAGSTSASDGSEHDTSLFVEGSALDAEHPRDRDDV